MNSVTIYTEQIDQKLSELISIQKSEKESPIKACVLVFEIQDLLKAKHNGNTNSKEYKKEASLLGDASGLKKSQFKKNGQIGEYVKQHASTNPELYTMKKTKIYTEYVNPKKPSEKTPVAKVSKAEYDAVVSENHRLKAENAELSAVIEQLCNELDRQTA
jgi:hypothetical protein